MDEINYRRLMSCPKRRCEDCGATAYQDPQEIYRCVVCDHETYETCLDCGHLRGWCQCAPVPEPAKKRARRARATKTKK